MTVTIQKPSQGRVVIYTTESRDRFPAFVDIYYASGTPSTERGVCTVIVFGTNGPYRAVNVPHDDEQGPHTWRFPKHEPTTIEVER